MNKKALVARPELPPHFFRRNAQGLIEAVETASGRVLAIQNSPHDLLAQKWDRLVRIDTPQGPVYIEKTLNFDDTRHVQEFPFSQMLADLLAEKIVEGKTLVEACKAMNLSYNVVIRWQRENKEFKLQLDQAKTDRAEWIHDEIIQEARTHASTKDKIAALQWAAEKGNAEKFGTKTKIIGDPNKPVTFILDTGIRRPGDQGYIAPTEAEKDVTPSGTGEQTGAGEEDEALAAYGGGIDDPS